MGTSFAIFSSLFLFLDFLLNIITFLDRSFTLKEKYHASAAPLKMSVKLI